MNNHPHKYNLRSGDLLYFLHIPKTAGTTFYNVLTTQFKPEEIFPLCDEQLLERQVLETPLQVLNKYRLMRAHYSYDIYKFLPRKPVYITVLRDPVERIISFHKHINRAPNLEWHYEVAQTKMSLTELLDFPPAFRAINNHQVRMIAGIKLRRKQKITLMKAGVTLDIEKYDELSDQAQLEIARTHLEEFIFFGLANRFEDSLRLLAYTFDWKPITQYKSLNVAPASSPTPDLKPEVIEAIKAHNELDLQLYAYAEEIFEERLQQMWAELSQASQGRNHM